MAKNELNEQEKENKKVEKARAKEMKKREKEEQKEFKNKVKENDKKAKKSGKGKGKKGKDNYYGKYSLFTRILAAALCIMMVFSVAVTLISYLVMS